MWNQGGIDIKEFKVFSDFACPFCYIGFSIAMRLQEENPKLSFHWYPYELDKETPEEGSNLGDSISKEQIEIAYRRIERLGSEYGLVYSNKTRKFNTGLLHRAAVYAQEVGLFYPFAKKAFKAIFEEGQNVALMEVVNEIGLTAGLDIQDMVKSIEDGRSEHKMEEARELAVAYGIESVPTFIREDGGKVTHLNEYNKFINDLTK